MGWYACKCKCEQIARVEFDGLEPQSQMTYKGMMIWVVPMVQFRAHVKLFDCSLIPLDKRREKKYKREYHILYRLLCNSCGKQLVINRFKKLDAGVK